MQDGGIVCGMFLEEGWQEEVGGKSSLKWYRLAKEEFGPERYVIR